MALALADAHEAGVLHRDFSPGNIIILTDGTGDNYMELYMVKTKDGAVLQELYLVAQLTNITTNSSSEVDLNGADAEGVSMTVVAGNYKKTMASFKSNL